MTCIWLQYIIVIELSKFCASTKYSRIQLLKCRLRIDSGEHNKPIQLGVQALENFDIWPYEMGIKAYYKVDFKYFNPLAYDSITKIALFWLKKNQKTPSIFLKLLIVN